MASPKARPTRPYGTRTTPLKIISALNGVSQRHFARASKLSYGYVTAVYNGRRAPTPEFVKAAEKLLGRTEQELFGSDGAQR